MKIIVFAPNWVGDVIFITPVFEALKKHFPDAHIGCILPARCKDILTHNPFVDEIITFNERKEDRSLLRKISFVFKLRSKKYDMVFLLHRSMTRAVLCAMAGIKKRIGYNYKKRSFVITDSIDPVNKDSMHKQDYYLNVLRSCGIAIDNHNCKIYFSLKEKSWTNEIIKKYAHSGEIKIGLNLMTNWAPKNWVIERFRELIDILNRRLTNVKFFLTSSTNQPQFDVLRKKNNVVDLTGQTSLLQLAAIYSEMDLIISGDSGPLHLGAAAGTKYIGLYGPTSPTLSGVRAATQGKIIFKNTSCPTPCYKAPCDKNRVCMNISVEEVAQAAIELLKWSN
jgi:lipopolysaccharide heptosyltransferase II